MKNFTNNKGITLVALIITIIILLILAAVTIMSITGDGIIGKSRQAKVDYEKGKQEEEGLLSGYLSKMDEVSSEEKERNPNIESYTEDGVPIPVGFRYITGEKDTGVVVQNEADGSEFVWVPVITTIAPYGLGTRDCREPDVITSVDGLYYDNKVDNLNIINNILGISYSNSDEFLTVLQNDFNAMAESVNKNGGFYVGRYETSLNGKKVQSVKGATSATAAESSANRWYGLYAYQKAYSTSSVQGSMIWGSQYDAMMNWIGNVEKTIGDRRNLTRETGSDLDDVIKNIYDLYGNSNEWTLEASNASDRIIRVGNYWIEGELGNRGYPPSTTIDDNIGSRLSLYIK